jgi:hypothetical protein
MANNAFIKHERQGYMLAQGERTGFELAKRQGYMLAQGERSGSELAKHQARAGEQ